MKKILITGGTGRFASTLKKQKTKNKLFFPNKKELDITKFKSIKSYIKKKNPQILIHLAGLSRPMSDHDTNIKKSIDLNIIGTANITKACEEKNIKLIYFSTNYVYPGKKGNYKETDSLLPVNSYAWSKLGGESSVQLYKNSLILRVCMTEKPFVHKVAFSNVKTSFTYHENIAKILFKLINKKGIINVGGPSSSVYDFARKENKNIIKRKLRKDNKIGLPFNSSINVAKMKKNIK
jgi:dTDP-4-dehydrorhamnose reductase|tara:strand:- start:1933 stop:2640 length:708 start_codon:yes stop_codon:yes gene_type:complete